MENRNVKVTEVTENDLLPYRKVSGSRADFRFESVEDFRRIGSAALPEHLEEQNEFVAKYFACRGTDWLGVKSWDEFLKAERDGWTAGVKRAYEMLGELDLPNIQPVSIRRKMKRRDQGDELDIHRVYAGDLERAWTASERAARSHVGGIINIAVNAGLNYNQHADELFWRSAAAVVLADKLTEAGYNVGIDMVSGCEEPTYKITKSTISVSLKQPSDPLDIATLTTALALSGFARLYLIGMVHCLPGSIYSGHGRSRDFPAEMLTHGTIICSFGVTDLQAAKKWLIDEVAKLSMPLAA